MPYHSPTATALHRKSPPTCTLSLAHVSASKFRSQAKSSFTVKNAELNLDTMQVELQVDFSSVISVPVQVQVSESSSGRTPSSIRRSKSKKRLQARRSEINVIPFPKSASPPPSPISDSSSSSSIYSSGRSNYSSSSSYTSSNGSSSPPAPHVLLRSSGTSSPIQSQSAQRVRKGAVKASGSISITTSRSSSRTLHSLSSRNSSPSPARLSSSDQPPSVSRTASAAHMPARPSSPTPHSPTQAPLQDKKQLKNEEFFDPPPYSLPPPPYSASPDLEAPSDSKTARPLPAPASVASSPPKVSRIPIATPSPLPHSQARRPRVSSSELKTLLYLYRTIMCGVERRHRLETSLKKLPSSEASTPSTSPGRSSENHFARFPLVEEDEDDDDELVFTGPQRAARRLSKSPADHAANYDVQDTVLAIKLRLFLKDQGISEDELTIQFDAEEDSGDRMVETNTVSASPADASVLADAAAAAPPILASPSPLPALVIAPTDRPIRSSPPPLSPVPQAKPHVIPSASYMIALLKMRNRQLPGKKRFSVVNDNGSASKGISGRGRRSGLSVCSWVAGSDVDENGAGLTVVEEVEEEFDCESLVDWYNY